MGTIHTIQGDYTLGTPDYDDGSVPQITVLDNDEPCDCYNASFSATLSRIEEAKIPYVTSLQNSNSVVGTALTGAGFELPKPPVFAPGFGNNLSRFFGRDSR